MNENEDGRSFIGDSRNGVGRRFIGDSQDGVGRSFAWGTSDGTSPRTHKTESDSIDLISSIGRQLLR